MNWMDTVRDAETSAKGSNSLDRIREAAEDAYDILCAMRADLNATLGDADYMTGELALRLFAGENPIVIWREHRGLTQKALAAQAGMTAAQLSEIEKGKKSGSIATLRKLAAALRVSVDDLLALNQDS